jgi:hypothetical protein
MSHRIRQGQHAHPNLHSVPNTDGHLVESKRPRTRGGARAMHGPIRGARGEELVMMMNEVKRRPVTSGRRAAARFGRVRPLHARARTGHFEATLEFNRGTCAAPAPLAWKLLELSSAALWAKPHSVPPDALCACSFIFSNLTGG